MRFEEFRDEAEGTSRTLGRNFGTRLTFEGEGAFTDRKRVNLPMLPEGAELTKEQVRMTRGYIDHEAGGHQRHTDIDSMEFIQEWAQTEGKPAVPKITNAMEDIRIEPKVIREYPGAKKNLEATTDAVCRMFLDEYVAEGGENYDPEVLSDRQKVLPLVVTWAGRKKKGYESKALDECIDLVDDELVKEAQVWADAAMACKDTWSVFELAKRMNLEVYEEEEKEEHEGPTGEGDGDLPVDGKSGEKGDGEKGMEAKAPGGDIRESSDDKPEPIEITMKEALENAFQEASDGAPDSEFRSYTSATDIEVTRDGITYLDGTPCRKSKRYIERINSKGVADYVKLTKQMRGIISTMKRKLERGLEDMMRRGRDDGKEYGSLDTRRLVQAYNRAPNVFWMPDEAPDMNTAVEVLIDMSGSMSGRKLGLAMLSSICLAEAMNTIGVPFEVTGFFSDGTNDEIPHGSTATRGYHRYQGETYFIFKSFKDSLREARGNLASIAHCCGYENCDGVSVRWVGKRLMKRPENKKVLMVLSDGHPAFLIGRGADRKVAHQYLPDVIKGLSDTGMHVVGIGICSDAVKRYYPHWVVLDDIEGLPGAVMSQVAKILMGKRVVLDNSELMKASSLGRRRVA